MRARLRAGLVLAALLTNVGLTGCGPGLPAGADGRLTDDWGPVAQVAGYVPTVGTCLSGLPNRTDGHTAPVIACTDIHYTEVVHVGAFPGDAPPGPVQLSIAYAECDAKAAAYLGRPWWQGRLQLHLTLPRDRAWDGGARWFRCDLVAVSRADTDSSFVTRAGSFKGSGFTDALTVGCATAVADDWRIKSMTEVPCAAAHNAEYAGFLRAAAGVPYPESDRQWSTLFRQCRDAIAPYLGMSRAAAADLGVIAWPASKKSWDAGDHRVRCAYWSGAKTLKKSVKGSKGKGLPSW
ncbi:septum formation family protein [Catellatospora vulcania]|uniref:septum formation family protein n=1 Tax=Catellatospora vulcania TaxID=1460450 RepID=UPI0012D37FFF|nr:septum formation family protein [Catellatospora vulcania]